MNGYLTVSLTALAAAALIEAALVPVRPIDVGWRIVGAEWRETGRIDRFRRGGDVAGETSRRRMTADGAVRPFGQHAQSWIYLPFGLLADNGPL